MNRVFYILVLTCGTIVIGVFAVPLYRAVQELAESIFIPVFWGVVVVIVLTLIRTWQLLFRGRRKNHGSREVES